MNPHPPPAPVPRQRATSQPFPAPPPKHRPAPLPSPHRAAIRCSHPQSARARPGTRCRPLQSPPTPAGARCSLRQSPPAPAGARCSPRQSPPAPAGAHCGLRKRLPLRREPIAGSKTGQKSPIPAISGQITLPPESGRGISPNHPRHRPKGCVVSTRDNLGVRRESQAPRRLRGLFGGTPAQPGPALRRRCRAYACHRTPRFRHAPA